MIVGTAAGSSDFITSFPATENPISQGGIWQLGLTNGLEWNDCQTTATSCCAIVQSDLTAPPGSRRYDDSLAHLKTSYRTFNANQFAQGTVYKLGGYDGNFGNHEIELSVRGAITAHSVQEYEVAWGIQGYLTIVRWNGAFGDFTVSATVDGNGSYGPPTFPTYNDGDVLRVEISGNVLTVYINSVQKAQVNITTDANWSGGNVYNSGQPGLGFWPTDGATPSSAGWKAYRAGNL
jgi:hypothetical protein